MCDHIKKWWTPNKLKMMKIDDLDDVEIHDVEHQNNLDRMVSWTLWMMGGKGNPRKGPL